MALTIFSLPLLLLLYPLYLVKITAYRSVTIDRKAGGQAAEPWLSSTLKGFRASSSYAQTGLNKPSTTVSSKCLALKPSSHIAHPETKLQNHRTRMPLWAPTMPKPIPPHGSRKCTTPVFKIWHLISSFFVQIPWVFPANSKGTKDTNKQKKRQQGWSLVYDPRWLETEIQNSANINSWY